MEEISGSSMALSVQNTLIRIVFLYNSGINKLKN